MKSLEEVIKYKLNFLPKETDPFYTIQKYGGKNIVDFYDLYETKNTIFSNDSFSLVEDITPLFIYISSCDKYYRENGHGKIETINISLDTPNFRRLTTHDFKILTLGDYNTLNDVFDDLGEHRIAIFKKRLNEGFSRVGYCIRYIEPFKIRISIKFIHFPTLINKYKIFKLEECVICLEEKPKVLFCNCGHICICEKCILNRYDNCPVCKKENTILRIIE